MGGVEVGGMQVVELLLSGRVPKVDAHVGAFDGGAVRVEGERVGGQLPRLEGVQQEAFHTLGLADGAVAQADDFDGDFAP